MAETTEHSAGRTRTETAEFLRALADELDSGSGRIRVPLGNKEIQLSPPETIDTEAVVTERSRRLRKDTEQLELTFKWNPTKDTAESDASASGTETDDERSPGAESATGNESETRR